MDPLAFAFVSLALHYSVLAVTNPCSIPPGGGPVSSPAFVPYSPQNKPIEGGLSSNGSSAVIEGNIFDTAISGSDSDTYQNIAIVSDTRVFGNSSAVQLVMTPAHSGEQNSGTLRSLTISSQTDSTVNYLVTRQARSFDRGAAYPVQCLDRYRLYDGQYHGSDHFDLYSLLWDSNVVDFVKVVYISKGTTP